jgi:hypothetical protein
MLLHLVGVFFCQLVFFGFLRRLVIKYPDVSGESTASIIQGERIALGGYRSSKERQICYGGGQL